MHVWMAIERSPARDSALVAVPKEDGDGSSVGSLLDTLYDRLDSRLIGRGKQIATKDGFPSIIGLI